MSVQLARRADSTALRSFRRGKVMAGMTRSAMEAPTALVGRALCRRASAISMAAVLLTSGARSFADDTVLAQRDPPAGQRGADGRADALDRNERGVSAHEARRFDE